MVMLLRHRQTKGPDSARLHLNRRATPRLHLKTPARRKMSDKALISTVTLPPTHDEKEKPPQAAGSMVLLAIPFTATAGSREPYYLHLRRIP